MRGDGITLDQVDPSWMEDGGGIIGDQPDYLDEDLQEWDTQPQTIGGETGDDFAPPGGGNACLTAAGAPPGSGTWVLGSIDGTCQWIDTTTCP